MFTNLKIYNNINNYKTLNKIHLHELHSKNLKYPMASFADKFKEAYDKAYEHHLKILKTKQEINELDNYMSLASSSITKKNEKKINYPIIIGNINTRASIVNIGTFPPYKYTKDKIYPIGYSVKKRGNPHKNYKKSLQNRVLYLCTIEPDGIVITADDDYVWKGEDLWEKFTADVSLSKEIKSVEDFIALNHPVIQKLIEEIGDISSFKDYVPVDQRKSK